MRNLILAISAASCLGLPAVGQTLERIKETGQLRLGYRVDAAPLSFQDADGNPAGYSPLICAHLGQAIANHLKMEELIADFFPVDASDRFEKVANGDIDLLCGAATITLERRKLVDFSIPTYVDGTAILQHRGAAGNFAELAGKKLGVRGSTTTKASLENTLAAENIEAKIISFASHDAGIAAMETREIDAYFADQSILLNMFLNSDKSGAFQVSGEVMSIEKHGIALSRGDTDFRLVIDKALSEMFATGKIQDIFQIALPGAEPGAALQAMYLLSPTLP